MTRIIEIQQDWVTDAVHLIVDGKKIGSIFVESVDLVAEVIEEYTKAILIDYQVRMTK